MQTNAVRRRHSGRRLRPPGRLSEAEQKLAEQHVQTVRGLIGSTARGVVAIGDELNALAKLVGKSRFAQYRAKQFGLKPGTTSNYRRAARAFSGLECLDHFQATAMFRLAARNVTPWWNKFLNGLDDGG